MTLRIPNSHVEGLRQWLGRTLHLPGSWRTPDLLDSPFAKCGYFLHPISDGDFIFQARYSACFVRKEKGNYRLEIRTFQKGVMRSEGSDVYIMRCPVVAQGLSQQSVRCGPSFIQVSRPLPLRSHSGQSPWLLSLRGELVASMEDASLMGLYVDINDTTVTIQSPRQDLLRRQEVLNTSAELLPLWLVSSHYAYSLEAACPLVSSQPETEVSVHIPKQRLGLVKRGSRVEERLNLKFLRVHQSDTFMVTEDRDFVVVSIPAAVLLQVQPCQQGRGAPGTQAFYRVDLSLEFAEVASPVLWMVENFFRCLGSATELPASATPRSFLSPPSPGPDAHPAEVPLAASSLFHDAGPVAQERPFRGPVHCSSSGLDKEPRPAGGSWATTVFLCPSAMQAGHGSQAPLSEAEVAFPTAASSTSEPKGAVQAGPRPSRLVFPALTQRLSSKVSSRSTPWRSGPSKVLLDSERSVTLMADPGPTRPEQDPAQPSGSLLLLGGDVASTESSQGEPDQASREFQPLTRQLVASLAEETLVSLHYPKVPQEASSLTGSKKPPQDGRGLSQAGAGQHLGLSSPEPSQDTERLGLTLLLGIGAISTTPKGQQLDSRAHLWGLETESSKRPGVDPADPLTALVESPLASTSAAFLVEGSSRALDTEPTTMGWQESEAAQATTSSPLQTLSLQDPAETVPPHLLGPGDPFSAALGTLTQQESTEPTLATTPESPRPPGPQHMRGGSLRGPSAGSPQKHQG